MVTSLKRVCYVIPSLSVGGTEKQLIHLMRGLVRDHELTVVCTHHDGTLSGDARRLGAVVRVLALWSGWDPRLRKKLTRVFRGHRPDIVHSFMFGFDHPVNQAARETGVPVVISSRRQLAEWRKRRHILLQRRANSLVDCILANSRAVADYAIAQEGASRNLVRIIPNAVAPSEFISTAELRQIRTRFNIPFHTKVVGLVANFSPVKDHLLFVETAAELLRRRTDLFFLMVGTGPLTGAVEREIHKRGLSDSFTRVRTIKELADLYAVMSVSVLCSHNEGFPNALLESMAAGTPVVAAEVGGVPELVEHERTGVLVKTRAPGDFADAIERVLDQPEESAAMALRAQQHVCSQFTVDAMVEAHRKLYAGLLVNSLGKDT